MVLGSIAQSSLVVIGPEKLLKTIVSDVCGGILGGLTGAGGGSVIPPPWEQLLEQSSAQRREQLLRRFETLIGKLILLAAFLNAVEISRRERPERTPAELRRHDVNFRTSTPQALLGRWAGNVMCSCWGSI
jgi:hypothetical protein